jgi:RHS repeat-associated protein
MYDCPLQHAPFTYKFTGKERDSESGLDNFGARYNSSAMGRWMSPDKINLTSARLVNPGNTLNKYVYGANNPLKYVDRDGEDITVFYRRSGSGAADFGHLFIGAFNQSTGRVGFLDYYPKTGTDSLGRGPGTFNNGNMQDRAAQADQFATLTIRTSPEEAQKVLNLIDKLKSGSAQDYAALSNNCTTVCEAVLHDLGLDFGDITPDQYWADLYRNFSQDVQDNPFKAFPFTQVPRQTGRDYGNPRNYGINFTQLLFLLYQYQNQPLAKATVCTDDHLGNRSCSSQ